jgi:hypothetical protein
LNIQKYGAHLKRIGAGGRKKTFPETVSAFKEFLTFFGEDPVTGEMSVFDTFGNVVEFFAGQIRFVERNVHGN